MGVRAMVQVPPNHAKYVTKVVLVDHNFVEFELKNPMPGVYVITFEEDQIHAWAYVRIHVDGDLWWGKDACDDGGNTAEERIWLSPTRFE
jgi:hypothetical protein